MLTFTAPSGMAPLSEAVSTSATIAETDGGITMTSLREGGIPCVLNYAVTGSTAAIVSSQSCMTDGVSVTYTNGAATLNGTTLTANLQGTVAGMHDTDAGVPFAVGATLTLVASCTKD
jgi:hypothetical protein